MIKKIPTERLKVGMYVHDLASGWISHPFLRNQFTLHNEDDIKELLKAGIRDVYIDTIKGLDDAEAPTEAEIRRAINKEMIAVARDKKAQVPHASTSEEFNNARRVHHEADKIIHRLMEDVRLGNLVTLEQVDPIVENVTASILRNPAALLTISRMKNKDNYTFYHSVSVCALMVAFCHHLGMAKEKVHQAGIGGLLHDIGKVRIPDTLLNKPGRLTEEEFNIMKSHVDEGGKILRETPGISETVIQITTQHHERYDGNGYSQSIAGDTISEMGQIASICDVYDAITSNRCYHKGLEPTDALGKIFEWRHSNFNPELVEAFLHCIGIYPAGSLVMLESGRIAIVIEQSGQDLLHPKIRVIFDSKWNHYLTPTDLDLSKSGGNAKHGKIIGHERPEKWGIDPIRFI